MTTWNDVVDHLNRHYKCEKASADLVRLVFGFGRRTQLVLVSRGAGVSGDWVQVQSPVGDPPTKKLIDLLEDCGSKLCGALVAMGGHVILRHSLPLATLNFGDLDWALGAIASTADDFEEKYVGGDAY